MKVHIIGGGNLGVSIALGLTRFSKNNQITVTRRNTTSILYLEELGVTVSKDNKHNIQEADVIILALGFSPEVPAFLKELNVETNSWGGIVIDSTFKTSNKKVYAGGDCQRGAHLAVTAAADGRDAARIMVKELL